jgi:hypothetical protein
VLSIGLACAVSPGACSSEDRQPRTATGGTAGGTGASSLSIDVEEGHAYLIKRDADPVPAPVVVNGTAATAARRLGSRTLGVVDN